MLKVKLKVNEVITTIMLNSVAIYLCAYLSSGPWKTSPGKPRFRHRYLTGGIPVQPSDSRLLADDGPFLLPPWRPCWCGM